MVVNYSINYWWMHMAAWQKFSVMCKVIDKRFRIHFSSEILCFHLKVEGLSKVCFYVCVVELGGELPAGHSCGSTL